MKVAEENREKFAEALFRLAHAFKNETENCTRMCGDVSEKEMAVIFFVGQNKNVKMSDIAENIVAPMSTLTNIVDKLVEKKFLNRDHSGEDRRVINVSLTANGKTAHKKITDKRKKLSEVILSSLNEKEQALITSYLDMLSKEIASMK